MSQLAEIDRQSNLRIWTVLQHAKHRIIDHIAFTAVEFKIKHQMGLNLPPWVRGRLRSRTYREINA